MELNKALLTDRYQHYKDNGLTDQEIELITSPLAHLSKEQSVAAFKAKDKLHG